MNDGISSWSSYLAAVESTEANLGQDALAGEKLGAKADNETKHGEAAMPGFSQIYESKAGCVVRHVKLRYSPIVTNRSDLLTVSLDTFKGMY